jgi:2-dehydropantoate 2-reductase
MKHAILGVGAIGGLLGTALASLGEEVIVVVRPEALSSYPQQLALERPVGAITATARAVSRLTEEVDLLWIATKTYQLQSAITEVTSMPGLVVPLLNGVDHIPVLRARFGTQCVLPATIAVEAERTAPGRFVQRSPFIRFNLTSSGESILGPLVRRLGDMGFSCQFTDNEQTLMWSKLCFLAPFALATSASEMNIGEVLAQPEWKSKLYSSVREACAVARAEGAEVDATEIQTMIGSAPPTMRSSMQKDLAAGRLLELDAIGGPIVRGGEHYGIEVPNTARLISIIGSKR